MAEHAAVKPKNPRFASIEEEAEFWDTHDSTEFEDEFEPVELQIADPLRHGLVLSSTAQPSTVSLRRPSAAGSAQPRLHIDGSSRRWSKRSLGNRSRLTG